MKTFKENFSTILLSLLELIVGILLLVSPVRFTQGILTAAGVVLSVVGLITLIQYFRTKAAEAASGRLMFKALVSLLLGVFLIFGKNWLIAVFPLLTMLYGVGILLTGLAKIQWTVDGIRMKKKRWWLSAIGAVISITCAVIIFADPFSSTTVLWMFTGVSLIVEAVMDIALLITASVLSKGDNT